MKYAIFIDIDGTLLNDNNIVSNRTKNIIHNIIDLGHKVVLCTGRTRIYAEKISKEIGASSYVISSNGAEIYDYKENKVIYSSLISKSVIVDILHEIKNRNAKITLAIDNIEYIIGKKYNYYQKYIPKNYNSFINNHNTKQAMIIAQNKDLKILRDVISVYDDVEITNKNTILEEQGSWFSIVKKGTSKGESIKEFCNYFNISNENIISIGNDYNDIPMFNQSKISIAVSNAIEDLKNKADIITESNNNDGVAKALEKLYLSIL
ncbi:MAG: HAD family hydrolase [Bacilli bacterium]|nr:HAD family hydrolase [Bacilli bacterium]